MKGWALPSLGVWIMGILGSPMGPLGLPGLISQFTLFKYFYETIEHINEIQRRQDFSLEEVGFKVIIKNEINLKNIN